MASIVCIGIAVLDQIFSMEELPFQPGKHFAHNYLEVGGGPAATAAVTIAKLGGEVEFWGRVGADEVGHRITSELEGYGVNVRHVRRVEQGHSSISSVLVDQQGERLIVNRSDPKLDADPSWLPLEELATKDAVLVDSRWPQGSIVGLKAARSYQIPAILDADLTPDNSVQQLVQQASHVAFSEQALKRFTNTSNVNLALKQARQTSDAWLCVTQGGEGTYWLEEEVVEHVPAFSVDVVDTLGAGDVFHGALAFALAEGQSIREAIRFSNATAALKCTQPGGRSGIPERDAVEALLQQQF